MIEIKQMKFNRRKINELFINDEKGGFFFQKLLKRFYIFFLKFTFYFEEL